jgi:hypothetical protein
MSPSGKFESMTLKISLTVGKGLALVYILSPFLTFVWSCLGIGKLVKSNSRPKRSYVHRCLLISHTLCSRDLQSMSIGRVRGSSRPSTRGQLPILSFSSYCRVASTTLGSARWALSSSTAFCR